MRTEKLYDGPNPTATGTVTGRRHFLAQLAGLAAMTALETRQSAAAVPETSQPAAPLPAIQLGQHRISRLVAGSNPISGYSYLGPHTDRQMKDYFTVERTAEFLQNCERAGITAHQFSDSDRAVPYLRLLQERGSKLQFFGLHAQREKLREAVALTQPIAMVHHGGVTPGES